MNNTIKKVLFGFLAYCVITLSIAILEGTIVTSKVPVSLPSLSIVNAGDGFVMAKGTWAKSSGDSLANVLQTSDIFCSKEKMECLVADASINNFFGRSLDVNVERYRIMEWTDSKVSYVNDTPLCVYYYYSIDRVAGSATALRTKKTSKETKGSPDCDAIDDTLKLVLRSGFDVWKEEQDKAKIPLLEGMLSVLLIWTKLF